MRSNVCHGRLDAHGRPRGISIVLAISKAPHRFPKSSTHGIRNRKKTDTPIAACCCWPEEDRKSPWPTTCRWRRHDSMPRMPERANPRLSTYCCIRGPFTGRSGQHLAVAPEYQRRGIATALLQHAVRTARDAGFRLLEIGTGDIGAGQIALYERCGFVRCGIDEDYFGSLPCPIFKRRRVPPHGAPAHGAEITDHVGRMEPVARMPQDQRRLPPLLRIPAGRTVRQGQQRGCVKPRRSTCPCAGAATDGSVPAGEMVYTCFTSDFLVEEAGRMARRGVGDDPHAQHLRFFFITKRIDRLMGVLPPDWGDGYENLIVGCIVENQAAADRRLPAVAGSAPAPKLIVCAPLLGPLDIAHTTPPRRVRSRGRRTGNDASSVRLLD